MVSNVQLREMQDYWQDSSFHSFRNLFEHMLFIQDFTKDWDMESTETLPIFTI